MNKINKKDKTLEKWIEFRMIFKKNKKIQKMKLKCKSNKLII